MTTPERIERRLPDLMAELAAARVPDYFDDMLQQAERTPQRPAWRSPERWLPMGVLARPAPLGLSSWRPLIVVVLIALAIAAGTILAAGLRGPTITPAPLYGPARNGPIAYSTPGGDIEALDPVSGRTTVLVAGDFHAQAPQFSQDGTRFLFQRVEGPLVALMTAGADGSDIAEILPPSPGGRPEWSPAGDRILVSDRPDPSEVLLIDTATGDVDTLMFSMDVSWAAWRPHHDQLVLLGSTNDSVGYYLANVDGTGLTAIPAAEGIVNVPTLSPDGRLLVYTTWNDGPGEEGVLRAHDLDTGGDSVLAPPDPQIARLAPQFSPDGTRLLLEHYDETGSYRIAVLPVEGGPEIFLGDPHPQMTNGAMAAWSPDGTQILVTYRDDDTSWLYAADGSSVVPAISTELASWRRLAP